MVDVTREKYCPINSKQAKSQDSLASADVAVCTLKELHAVRGRMIIRYQKKRETNRESRRERKGR